MTCRQSGVAKSPWYPRHYFPDVLPLMDDKRNTKVPASRLGRLGRFARLAGSVASGMAAEGMRQLAAGNRPKLQHLVLTPANVRRLTTELSKMRGAAMKLGQILSMDTGDFIPEELAEILAHLRADAHHMPVKQLEKQLVRSYGPQWRDRFASFEMRPIAAASIGQVHRAVSLEGRELALKIQYPGVRRSIDSDVSNLASLLKVTGLLPQGLEIKPILDEVKKQLHDEASYALEAKHLASFGEALKDDARFVLPGWVEALSTDGILAMDYLHSQPIEHLKSLPQDRRDHFMGSLFELMLKELFELRLMQTDPNFANYRYQPEHDRIVLLDFGATRKFTARFANAYLRFVKAILSQDESRITKAAANIGYHNEDLSPGYQKLLLTIFALIGDIFRSEQPYDFHHSPLAERMTAINEEMMSYRDEWRTPPTEVLYVHRKLGGMFMLASRLHARVALRPLLERYL